MNEEIDPQVLRLISYGLYVVSSKINGKMNGQIVNTVFQVTATPPRIAVSINKQNLTHEYIKRSGVFSVSILDQSTPMQFIGLFGFKSGRDVDKLCDIQHYKGISNCPIVTENALGIIEAKVINQLDVGSHTVFVADVVSGKILREGTPLTYAIYQEIKGGKAPKTAPTYLPTEPTTAPTYMVPQQKAEEKTSSTKQGKYRCDVCGWIYDPEIADPEHDINPGTAFEDLPDDWVCPVCGAGKNQFSPI